MSGVAGAVTVPTAPTADKSEREPDDKLQHQPSSGSSSLPPMMPSPKREQVENCVEQVWIICALVHL